MHLFNEKYTDSSTSLYLPGGIIIGKGNIACLLDKKYK